MQELINRTREYLDYVERHYHNVKTSFKLIVDSCDESFRFISDPDIFEEIAQNIEVHDASKLGANEFTQYRQFFYTTSNEVKDKGQLVEAFDHHKKVNGHHWESWTQIQDERLQYIYFIENVVDWMAMGIEKGDTARIFYDNNKDKISYPKWAEEELYRIMDAIGH